MLKKYSISKFPCSNKESFKSFSRLLNFFFSHSSLEMFMKQNTILKNYYSTLKWDATSNMRAKENASPHQLARHINSVYTHHFQTVVFHSELLYCVLQQQLFQDLFILSQKAISRTSCHHLGPTLDLYLSVQYSD